MSFESLLNKSVAIYARTQTRSRGSITNTYTVAVAAYLCRIYGVKPRVVKRTSGEDIEASVRIIGKHCSNIVEGACIKDGTVIYEVVGTHDVFGEVDVHHQEGDLVRRDDLVGKI